MVRFLTVCCLISSLLTGCADIIPPESGMTDPDRLSPGKAISASAKTEWPDEAWWKAYHDPQLDDLVSKSVSGNPGLKTAMARVRLSLSFADGMRANTLPRGELDGSSHRERFTALQFIPPPWGGHTDWNNSASVSLSYDLDFWGKLKSRWQSSIDEARARLAEEREVRIELETAVVRSYLRLAEEFELRDIAQRHLAELDERAEIERRRMETGLGTQMALHEARAPLPIARAAIEEIDLQIARSKSELAALAGKGPGGTENISRPKISLDSTIGLPDRLPAHLLGRRPDIAACKWKIEAARHGIDAAKAAFYPDVNLAAMTGFTALGFGQFIGKSAWMAGAGPALSLPIFDGGKRRADLAASTASYDIAVEQYNAAVVSALKEVSDDLVAFRIETAREREAADSLGIAKDDHELAIKSYRAGLSEYRRVLETEAKVLKAEGTLARIREKRLEAHAGLMLALGGGTK